jgi:hypothetical protein
MPRDRNKKVYVTIGIQRDSATYAALLADCHETGLSLARLIATRLADWYRPGVAAMATTRQQGQFGGSQQPTGGSEEANASALELQQRAAQAAAAWATFDEE